jgi:cytidine deaminase
MIFFFSFKYFFFLEKNVGGGRKNTFFFFFLAQDISVQVFPCGECAGVLRDFLTTVE